MSSAHAIVLSGVMKLACVMVLAHVNVLACVMALAHVNMLSQFIVLTCFMVLALTFAIVQPVLCC